MHRIGSGTVAILTVAALLTACGSLTQGPPTSSSAARPSAATPTTTPSVAAATPILANVVAAPVPVPTTDGKRHLAYEVALTNALDGDVTLKSLSVKAGTTDLLTLTGDRLAYWTRALGATQTPTTTLGPGRAGVVWLDVVLDESAPVST